jgi:hypothetical protein
MQIALRAASSSYPTLDNLVTLMGLAISLLSLLSFREYSYLMLINSAINLTLYVVMSMDNPAQITYLIYGINSTICVSMQFFSVRKLYREQRIDKTKGELSHENDLSEC